LHSWRVRALFHSFRAKAWGAASTRGASTATQQGMAEFRVIHSFIQQHARVGVHCGAMHGCEMHMQGVLHLWNVFAHFVPRL
jgi:hypothetical protein